jgi:invasion protein IalB
MALLRSDVPLFALGQLVTTKGALAALQDAGQGAHEFLNRHMAGDWGDLCAADREENECSLNRQLRILSSYQTALGVKLWVITEADRSVTTILLPDEY